MGQAASQSLTPPLILRCRLCVEAGRWRGARGPEECRVSCRTANPSFFSGRIGRMQIRVALRAQQPLGVATPCRKLRASALRRGLAWRAVSSASTHTHQATLAFPGTVGPRAEAVAAGRPGRGALGAPPAPPHPAPPPGAPVG